mmetsp:Transcript_38322/g.112193  ORF Transcript_38322/g.112193 Transcript_38322/m.112193 type:complete len:207 (+) Transcript_38322:898-1518(+)
MSYIFMSCLGVVMSYAGFFINPAATPGRVALAVITVLCVSSTIAGSKSQLPPHAYSTWLGDYMLVSLCFNIVGFIEMAAVNLGITLNAKYESNAKTAEHKQGQVFAAPDLGKGRELGADGGDPDANAEASMEFPRTIHIVKATGKPYPYLMPRKSQALNMIDAVGSYTSQMVRSMKDLDYTMRWLFPLCYLIFVAIMVSQIGRYNA